MQASHFGCFASHDALKEISYQSTVTRSRSCSLLCARESHATGMKPWARPEPCTCREIENRSNRITENLRVNCFSVSYPLTSVICTEWFILFIYNNIQYFYSLMIALIWVLTLSYSTQHSPPIFCSINLRNTKLLKIKYILLCCGNLRIK